tara:strand:+ start:2911 stop:3318 length:408 start_codon:yes stop_codon:yes gene_type:complete
MCGDGHVCGGAEPMCAICWEDDTDVVLDCGHHYHDACLEKWISSFNGNCCNCPTCRKLIKLPPDDRNYKKLMEIQLYGVDLFMYFYECEEEDRWLDETGQYSVRGIHWEMWEFDLFKALKVNARIMKHKLIDKLV